MSETMTEKTTNEAVNQAETLAGLQWEVADLRETRFSLEERLLNLKEAAEDEEPTGPVAEIPKGDD